MNTIGIQWHPNMSHYRATWSLLPFVLALGFLVRFSVGLSTGLFPHPDVQFQYLEQAHRLTFGYGIIPWEYVYGIRSWIIPGFIALILSAVSAVGLDSPLAYQPVIKFIFCGISLALPLSVYRIGQSLLDETGARLALLASTFWYELVYVAHTPLADALATYALFGALMYLFQPRSRSAVLAFGVLVGLTLILRYQLAPPVLIMSAIAAFRWGWRGWPAVLTLTVVLVLSGALDAYTWGIWFSSIIYNLELNFFEDIAGQFAREPVDFYFVSLAVMSLGLAYLGFLGLALSWRQTWPLSAVGLTLLLAFTVVSHKETRFIFALTPIYLIGIAALLTGEPIRRALSAGTTVRIATFLLAPTLLMLLVTVITVGTSLTIERDPLQQAYLMLSERSDVEGLIDDSGRRWYLAPGYYYLHRNVPIYRRGMSPDTTIAAALETPTRFVTHWITRSDVSPSADYTLLAQIADFWIWQRSGGFGPTEVAPGYTNNAPFPMEVETLAAIQPRTKARW